MKVTALTLINTYFTRQLYSSKLLKSPTGTLCTIKSLRDSDPFRKGLPRILPLEMGSLGFEPFLEGIQTFSKGVFKK